MLCPKCQKPQEKGARFCSNCGAKLTEPEEISAQHQEQRDPQSSKQSLNYVLITVCCVCAVLVVVLAVLLSQFLDFTFFDRLFPVSPQEPVETVDFTIPVPTEPVVENGLTPENPYYDCYMTYSNYVLPQSGTVYLSRGDIASLSDEALDVAIQEIYARHGQVASQRALQDYFDARPWFADTDVGSPMNHIEETNLFLLETHRKERSGELSKERNPYIVYLPASNGYLEAESGSDYLTAEHFKDRNQEQLTLLRSEIYARHGYIFEDPALMAFFCCTDWYRPAITAEQFSEEVFNEYEVQNLRLTELYERKLKGVTFSANNPYKNYFTTGFIFPDSDTGPLNEIDLMDMNREQLVIARNEIFARHGYTFGVEELLEYFLQCPWYNPTTLPGVSTGLPLTGTEWDNLELLNTMIRIIDDLEDPDTSLVYAYATDAYTVYMPAYWEEYGVVSDGGFYEKYSKDICGGFLFGLRQVENLDDFYHPNYSVCGKLIDSFGQESYLVAYRPTDVQFSLAYIRLYNRMSGDAGLVIGSVTPNSGYTYIPR